MSFLNCILFFTISSSKKLPLAPHHSFVPSTTITSIIICPNKMVTSPPLSSSNPLTNLVHGVLSFDGNIMLAAIISLLLVILFVLLLHVYAKWFLGQAQYNQRIRRRPISIPSVLGSRFHHFHTFTIDTSLSSSPTKGLESSAIASVPLFVYKKSECKNGLECVICLTVFEEEEVGRNLPKCGHAFHVECIDMWLHSHSTCPICRASVLGSDGKIDELNSILSNEERELSELGNEELEIIVEVLNSENIENVGMNDDSLSACSSSSSGCPLKRMMSGNNGSKLKFLPSDDVNGIDS